jgi:ADP-ribose pyrophosphatase YjhB (NUDIX family)
MKKYPNVTIKIIFRYKNETLLLGHKNGVFSFPGGRMEWGESILGTLNRELKEELGYSLESEPELLDVWNYISKNKLRHSVMIYFIQRLTKKPKFYSPEKLKTLWLKRNSNLLKNIIREKKFIDKIFNWKKLKIVEGA